MLVDRSPHKQNTVKTLVVDDQLALLDTTERALLRIAPDMTILVAQSLDDAIDIAANNGDIDLVVLDLGLPNCVGLSALKKFKETFKYLRVAVFSGDDVIADALDLGAVAYIRKPIDIAPLTDALEKILGGGVYISGISVAQCEMQDAAKVLQLNPQEYRVAQLWVRGTPIAGIAKALHTSEIIIKKLVSKLLRHLNASRRSEAMIEISRCCLTFAYEAT